MALLDHFAENAGTGPLDNGFFRIPAHQFTDTIFFWSIDQPGISRALVISTWNLTEAPTPDADTIQLDLLAAEYDAAPTLEEKQEYIHKVESSLRLLEFGVITVETAAVFMDID